MPEPYLDAGGELIPEEAWRSLVDGLARDGSEALPIAPERRRKLLQELQGLLKEAIKRRLPRATAAATISSGSRCVSDSVDSPVHRSGRQSLRVSSQDPERSKEGSGGARIALLFSGGIDSTLIAFILKRLAIPFTCITVGFRDGKMKEPEDVTESRRVAEQLGFDQEIVMLDLEQAHELFTTTARILGPELTNVVNVGVGSVEVAGFERGKALGITCFFGGLGAEELFAGYDRHERAFRQGGHDGLATERRAGLRRLHVNDLRRDCAIAEALGITLATPFLDGELAKFALSLPPELLIDPERTFPGRARGDVPVERLVRKLLLREAAEAMGLPHGMAFRPKRAAQYGSRTNNALTRLTELHGFRHKEEYLASLL